MAVSLGLAICRVWVNVELGMAWSSNRWLVILTEKMGFLRAWIACLLLGPSRRFVLNWLQVFMKNLAWSGLSLFVTSVVPTLAETVSAK